MQITLSTQRVIYLKGSRSRWHDIQSWLYLDTLSTKNQKKSSKRCSRQKRFEHTFSILRRIKSMLQCKFRRNRGQSMWRHKVFQSLPIQLPHIALWPALIGLKLAKNYSNGAIKLSLTQNLVMRDSLKIEDLCKKLKTYQMTYSIQLGSSWAKTLKDACLPKTILFLVQ